MDQYQFTKLSKAVCALHIAPIIAFFTLLFFQFQQNTIQGADLLYISHVVIYTLHSWQYKYQLHLFHDLICLQPQSYNQVFDNNQGVSL